MRQAVQVIFTGVVIASILTGSVPRAFADTISDLQKKIADSNTNITALQSEIAGYETQLQQISTQKDSLANAIAQLTINQKKLEADIAVTQDKIDQADAEISQLNLGITDKESSIADAKTTLGQTMRTVNAEEGTSLVEVMLSNDSLASFLEDIGNLENLQGSIQADITNLQNLRTDLQNKRAAQTAIKQDQLALESKLNDQKDIILQNKQAQEKLLADTKNKESNYQDLIANKKAQEQEFEKELLDYQSQLKTAVDPNSYPTPGTQVLEWPLDNVRITQYFGNTPFAKSGAYNGKGHDGVDFGAPIGTPIKAARGGVVQGTGNTDLTCPGASFGKWIFIKHDDGLSTIYAHLSLIKVNQGDTVTTGQLIGYSGDTGYVTGPHLHFGVYASQGAQIGHLQSKVCNATYTMPLAPLDAYLNPMDYLPTYTGPQPN